jgi:hypothetical protein
MTGVQSQPGVEILLFATMIKLTLGTTHLPIQWLQRSLSLVVKQTERETEHAPPPTSKVPLSSEVKQTVCEVNHSS